MTKEKPEESDKNEITPHYLAHLNSGYKVDLQEHSRISMPLPHGRDVVHKKGKRNNWIQIVILFIATNLLLSFS
jgi:hypothetical protein